MSGAPEQSRLKELFLERVGVTNTAPYEGLSAAETVHTLVRNAALDPEVVARVLKGDAETLFASGDKEAVLKAAQRIEPLLTQKVRAGDLTPDSFEPKGMAQHPDYKTRLRRAEESLNRQKKIRAKPAPEPEAKPDPPAQPTADEAKATKEEQARLRAEASERNRQERDRVKAGEKEKQKEAKIRAAELAAEQAAARAAEEDIRLRTLFFSLCGITNPAPYDTGEATSLHGTLRQVAQMLRENVGFTAGQAGTTFDPPLKAAQMQSRINGDQPVGEAFIRRYAQAVRELLDVGVENGWLDPESRKPKTLEAIVAQLGGLPAAELKGATGEQAVYRLLEASGLPDAAASCLAGHEYNWLSLCRSGERRFTPAIVSRFAHFLAPYVSGEQKWNKVLEVTDPEYLENHRIARDYLLGELRRMEGIREADVHAMLGGEPPATLGPTIGRLSAAAGLAQTDFPDVRQPDIHLLESNCFCPYCLDADGQPKEALRRKLDSIAANIAYNWLHRNDEPKPGVTDTKVHKTKRGKPGVAE